VICECFRLNDYFRQDYQLSHYQTTAGGEVDLILHRARKVLAIEIKSTDTIDVVEVAKLARAASALKSKNIIYVSQHPVVTQIDDVLCLPWDEFLRRVFVENSL